MNRLTLRQVLDYEIKSSWWATEVSWPLFQDLAARYFAWKAKRKYKRYLKSLEREKRVSRYRAVGKWPG